jgi:hypothetical protein
MVDSALYVAERYLCFEFQEYRLGGLDLSSCKKHERREEMQSVGEQRRGFSSPLLLVLGAPIKTRNLISSLHRSRVRWSREAHEPGTYRRAAVVTATGTIGKTRGCSWLRAVSMPSPGVF